MSTSYMLCEIRLLWRLTPRHRGFPLRWRSFSTTSQADPILQYVQSVGEEQRQLATDVLEGGIAREQELTSCDAVRLNTALAELHAVGKKPSWQRVAQASDAALTAGIVGLAEPCLKSWATAVQLRASAALAQGSDVDLRQLHTRLSTMHALSPSLEASVGTACWRHVDVLWRHASGVRHDASQLRVTSLRDSFGALPPLSQAIALKDSTLALLSEGFVEEATQALTLALEGVESNAAGGGAPEAQRFPPTPLLFGSWWDTALKADIHLAQAQVAIAHKRWEAAEASLDSSISCAEGARGADHWSIGLPIILTGYVYARTGRVVMAEGLFREALKRLHASVDGSTFGATEVDAHPSCTALAAWRFAQLLSVLPKRDSETRRWTELASTAWARSNSIEPGRESIQSQFGALDALSGNGSHGKLVSVNWVLGRVFPGVTERS